MSTGQCAVRRSPIATAISVVLVSSIYPCRPTATAAAMTALRIDKGHFGDVDLSGVTWCGDVRMAESDPRG